MEIINYIQQPEKRSFGNFSISRKNNYKTSRTDAVRASRKANHFGKRGQSRSELRAEARQRNGMDSCLYTMNFSTATGSQSFAVTQIRPEISVRSVFASIGQGVSDFGSLIKSNVKFISILLSALVIASGVFTGVLILSNYVENHTGPLSINAEDSFSLESLDKLMSDFALEVPEVDADGNITGVEESIPASLVLSPVEYQNYRVKSGDTISGIAKKFGLKNISTLISVNDISNVRQLGAGQKLKIPSMDGIIYTVKKGDNLNSIVTKYNVKLSTLLDVNELNSESLTAGQQLFIPGASLDSKTLQNAMGELFIIPISAAFRWTSPYGWRADPFTGVKSFHTGTDMACPQGTPILAAMSGRVADVGYNRIYGNYVIINHGNGYQTLYAHQSKTIAKKGDWVVQGAKIGLVGSTGYSTGPHLHFMVYKNGSRIDPMTVLRK